MREPIPPADAMLRLSVDEAAELGRHWQPAGAAPEGSSAASHAAPRAGSVGVGSVARQDSSSGEEGSVISGMAARLSKEVGQRATSGAVLVGANASAGAARGTKAADDTPACVRSASGANGGGGSTESSAGGVREALSLLVELVVMASEVCSMPWSIESSTVCPGSARLNAEAASESDSSASR